MKKTQATVLMSAIRRSNTGLLTVLACLLAACCCGAGASAPASTPASTAPVPAVPEVRAGTWVVMGSSTAAGAGAPAGKGWVALLESGLASRGAQVANIAKVGAVTYHGLSATAQAVSGRPLPDLAINIDQALARKPVVLIVSYPTNDTALGYSSDETVNNILSMRSLALENAVPVIVMSSQPRNLAAVQLAQLRGIDTRLASSSGPCFVDVRSVLAATDGLLAVAYDSGDGTHPNEVGHRLFAVQVRAALDGGKCVRIPPG